MSNVQTKALELQFAVQNAMKLHPAISRTLTLAGTAHTGDSLNFVFTPINGSSTTISYVLVSGDTLITAASAMAGVINASGVSTSTLNARNLTGSMQASASARRMMELSSIVF